jgi:hypothetical protein
MRMLSVEPGDLFIRRLKEGEEESDQQEDRNEWCGNWNHPG